jgi:hypothetical protein
VGRNVVHTLPPFGQMPTMHAFLSLDQVRTVLGSIADEFVGGKEQPHPQRAPSPTSVFLDVAELPSCSSGSDLSELDAELCEEESLLGVASGAVYDAMDLLLLTDDLDSDFTSHPPLPLGAADSDSPHAPTDPPGLDSAAFDTGVLWFDDDDAARSLGGKGTKRSFAAEMEAGPPAKCPRVGA